MPKAGEVKKETKQTGRTDIVRAGKHEYNSQVTPLIVKAMVSVGATQPKIAAELGISRATLNRWLKQYPELKTAYDLGMQDDLQMVEASFFHMCMPHFLEEQEVHYNKDGEIIKTVKKVKQVDPNVQAMYRYLICKGRDVWTAEGAVNMPNVKITIEKTDENL